MRGKIEESKENEEIEDTEAYDDEDSGNLDDEGLPFAKAEVVRLMKQNLDSDKMIRERVKVEMNRFLGDVLKKVCKQLNTIPIQLLSMKCLKNQLILHKH